MKDSSTDKAVGDAAYEVGRTIVAAVSAADGPLHVLCENAFQVPLDKRRQAWIQELACVVEELQEKVDGLRPESLAQDEAFVTVALQASQVAMCNHRPEKLRALRNAVLNSALPSAPSEDVQMVFLRLVDELTPLHLRLLAFLDSPGELMQCNEVVVEVSESLCGVIEVCFPELAGQRNLYFQLVKDLQNRGLVAAGSYLQTGMSGQGLRAPRTSDLGRRFLKYTSEPGTR